MAQLNFEAIRHRVKLLRDSGDEQLFENRDDVSCPVCGVPFVEALATTARTCELSPTECVDVCIVRENERLITFTHARKE